MTHTALLQDRAVLSVSGPEARDFLQGLITQDVKQAAPERLLHAALLTPQGKILFDFLIGERDGALLLDLPASQRDALQKRLTLYRLRAKLEIAPRDDLAIFAAWNGAALAGGLPDPRLPELGLRAIASKDTQTGTGDYLAHRLALGVPEGTDFGQDKLFALDADLDELNAISFTKGCYVGQELTARMKHRSTARKRLLMIETLDGTNLPPPETPVTANSHELGNITASYGAKGFAAIRLDRLEENTATPEATGVNLRLTKPNWLGLS